MKMTVSAPRHFCLDDFIIDFDQNSQFSGDGLPITGSISNLCVIIVVHSVARQLGTLVAARVLQTGWPSSNVAN